MWGLLASALKSFKLALYIVIFVALALTVFFKSFFSCLFQELAIINTLSQKFSEISGHILTQ